MVYDSHGASPKQDMLVGQTQMHMNERNDDQKRRRNHLYGGGQRQRREAVKDQATELVRQASSLQA